MRLPRILIDALTARALLMSTATELLPQLLYLAGIACLAVGMLIQIARALR